MADFSFINPFSKYFLRGKPEVGKEHDAQYIKNAQGVSEEDQYFGDDGNQNSMGNGPSSNFFSTPIHFQQYFASKRQRVGKYREMSMFAEISDALDTVADDSIITDDDGIMVDIEFKKELTKRQERKIKEEFNYLLNNVFHVDERLWDLFRKWLVEGELFMEMVLNDKKTSIIGLKPLASFNTFPVYERDIITGFIQNVSKEDDEFKSEGIPFPVEQVTYVNYGVIGKNKLDVRGYLESSVRVYNQLRNLEDAVVVTRLVRAPERRVWNIEVGRMPSGKAEEYIRKMIHKYRKQVNYNPETGAIDSAQNVQSLTEDFWFAKRDGVGTNVDTLQSTTQLGELEDINYFLKKLYKTLKMPKNRFEDTNSVYNPGRNLEREEIKFSKFIERLQNRFKKIFMDVLIEQMKIKKFDTNLIDRSLYEIRFTKANYFKDFKELEILEARLNVWSTMSGETVSPDNPTAAWSREYVMRQMMQMTDEEFKLNKKLREEEIKNLPEPEDDGGSDDFGAFGSDKPDEKEPEKNEPEKNDDKVSENPPQTNNDKPKNGE